MRSSPSGAAYLAACSREHVECALELLNAFNQHEREAVLNHRAQPLSDTDLMCIADGLREKHTLRILNLEDNSFGLTGVQAVFDAVVSNPGCLRELRLAKNRLKDPSAVIIGNALSLNGGGLKVLDLSENNISKLGVTPLCQALQSKACDIVEFSLHNNNLEADAALPLSQAARQSQKLKHLHLGYNSFRDAGAVQFARCLPIAASLSTLDLTANRIGPQGGMELARALLSPSCTLQRLNLRHNNFDNETFEAFGDVILKNNHLTQLFLGFMKPSRDTAAQVLSTLRYNRSLLLFDFYGWGMELNDGRSILDDVLMTNPVIRALITDLAPIAQGIDSVNRQRHDNGLPITYVGPDDRSAFSAAAIASKPATRSNSELVERSVSGATARTSSVPALKRPPSTKAISTSNPPSNASTPRDIPTVPIVTPLTGSKSLDSLLKDLQRLPVDGELKQKVTAIAACLQSEIESLRTKHAEQYASLEDRVRALEVRPAVVCSQGHQVNNVSSRIDPAAGLSSPAPKMKTPSKFRNAEPSVSEAQLNPSQPASLPNVVSPTKQPPQGPARFKTPPSRPVVSVARDAVEVVAPHTRAISPQTRPSAVVAQPVAPDNLAPAVQRSMSANLDARRGPSSSSLSSGAATPPIMVPPRAVAFTRSLSAPTSDPVYDEAPRSSSYGHSQSDDVPLNPNLQPSHALVKPTKLDASPQKQERMLRKPPPSS